mgnify:CR=1 FL=1
MNAHQWLSRLRLLRRPESLDSAASSPEVCQCHFEHGLLRVRLRCPRFDASRTGAFKARLEEVEWTEIDRIEFNLSEVDFIDSSGVGALLAVYRQAGHPDRLVSITGASGQVLSTLELLRMHRVFQMESS